MNCWSLDPKRIKIATDTLACTSFCCQIHFPGKISAKGSQELYGAIAGDFRGSILGNGGEARQEPHIGLHSRSSARTPHLYDNVGAVEQRSRVGLRYRRSEEHTSELQSLMRISYAVFCLKKKKNTMHRR